MIEGLPRHKLHDDEKHASHLPEVIHTNEIGVIEPRHRLGFRFKIGAERFILAKLTRQNLDGNRSVQRKLHRFINRAHATGGNKALNLVPRKKGG